MNLDFRKLVIAGLIITVIIFIAQWKLAQLEDKMNDFKKDVNNQITQNFKQLSDSVSAQSEVNVVLQPTLFEKFFNTAENKRYEEIKKMIPNAIKEELNKHNLDKGTIIITKNQLLIKGDSAVFLNSDGVVTKTAKVQPINGDSSLLIIVPQEIELTTVTATADKKDPSKLNVFVSAYNKTTGDSLKIDKAITYVLDKNDKKWEFNYKPYIGFNYDLRNGSGVPKAGIDFVTYNSKRIKANIGGIEIRQNLKNQESFVDLKILQLQFK